MKKAMFIGATLLLGMMMIAAPADAQSRKDKKAAKKAEWEHQQKIKEMQRQRELDSIANLSNEVAVDIPCMEFSISESEEDPYFRELGIGEDLQRPKARLLSIENANSMIKRRLGGVVKGLATDYSKSVSTKSSPAHMEQIIEQEYTTMIDKVLRDAAKPCEKIRQDRSGRWISYYVVWVGREELADKLADALSQNEELKAEFDRDRFRQFAKEYMQGK